MSLTLRMTQPVVTQVDVNLFRASCLIIGEDMRPSHEVCGKACASPQEAMTALGQWLHQLFAQSPKPSLTLVHSSER